MKKFRNSTFEMIENSPFKRLPELRRYFYIADSRPREIHCTSRIFKHIILLGIYPRVKYEYRINEIFVNFNW